MLTETLVHSSQFFVKHKYVKTLGVIELKIWSIPLCSEFPEGIKYTLSCVNRGLGEVVVGFTNRHPGHWMQLGNVEKPYFYNGLRKLVEDFYFEVKARGYLL